jgi:pimeloyl-ACP methyl ester carboxylesterase
MSVTDDRADIHSEGPEVPEPSPPTWTRRRVLAVGLGGVVAMAALGAAGVELVSHGVLPGDQTLDRLDGACDVAAPDLHTSTLGPSTSGRFYSDARRTTVGYTIAYPPGHAAGSALPLVVMLHGFGGNHATALAGLSPAGAVALRVGGRPLTPMALVTVDGGNGYWNPHPGDDPLGMVMDELIPRCQRMGLGTSPASIATMGISMGGYGALLIAERYPRLVAAVAAISPAVWTSYAEAQAANAGAFASAAAFHADDVISHAHLLAGRPVRIASADDDPFHPGVEALVRALPAGAVVQFAPGCHTGPFFVSQEPAALSFLSTHLGGR